MSNISSEIRPVAIRQGYVPAIDGLRFFAIGSVLLFHLWRPILPGGFIGVDVFFVISGYLITGVLTNPRHAPTLIEFYQNRIARIAPASIFTIIITLIAGYFIYDQQDFAYIGSAGAYSSVSLINVKLIFQSSYFEASPIAQPLLHFWSLSLEEQFYIAYPAFLISVARCKSMAIKLAAAASFAICLYLTWRNQNWAFYFIGSRAWELLAGGWLALRSKRSRYGQYLGWLGLCILLLSFFLIQEGDLFPGVWAIFPVIATLLMLEGTRTSGTFSSFLSQQPLRWIGLRSFSLYLWHWPIYSFLDYTMWQYRWHDRVILKILLTIILSTFSYKIIENPSRYWLRLKENRYYAYTIFIISCLLLFSLGSYIRSTSYLSAEAGILSRGGYHYPIESRPRITVIGDSEGAMYGTIIRDIARKNNWSLRLLAAAATNELKGETNSRWNIVEPWLRKDRPNVVIIIYNWRDKLKEGESLERTIDSIEKIGSRSVIVLEPPRPSSQKNYNPRIFGKLRMPEYERNWRQLVAKKIKMVADRHPNTIVVDPGYLFIDNEGMVTVSKTNERPLFYDFAHLSGHGVKRVAPHIETAVRYSLRKI